MLDLYDNQEAERAEIYRLFSALFLKEPSPETIEEFKEMFRIKSDEAPDVIQRDFAALFLGTDFHPSPYESLYNFSPEDKPGIGGKAARKAQAFYEAAGLTLDEEMNLVPDHLSVELLFMSYLIENDRSGEQRDFMEGHLMPWVPAFCDEIRKHASTVFYKEAADLLKEFIASEHESMIE